MAKGDIGTEVEGVQDADEHINWNIKLMIIINRWGECFGDSYRWGIKRLLKIKSDTEKQKNG